MSKETWKRIGKDAVEQAKKDAGTVVEKLRNVGERLFTSAAEQGENINRMYQVGLITDKERVKLKNIVRKNYLGLGDKEIE
jgi:hypothetical protein